MATCFSLRLYPPDVTWLPGRGALVGPSVGSVWARSFDLLPWLRPLVAVQDYPRGKPILYVRIVEGSEYQTNTGVVDTRRALLTRCELMAHFWRYTAHPLQLLAEIVGSTSNNDTEGWTTTATENTLRSIHSCMEFIGILQECLEYIPLYSQNPTQSGTIFAK